MAQLRGDQDAARCSNVEADRLRGQLAELTLAKVVSKFCPPSWCHLEKCPLRRHSKACISILTDGKGERGGGDLCKLPDLSAARHCLHLQSQGTSLLLFRINGIVVSVKVFCKKSVLDGAAEEGGGRCCQAVPGAWPGPGEGDCSQGGAAEEASGL